MEAVSRCLVRHRHNHNWTIDEVSMEAVSRCLVRHNPSAIMTDAKGFDGSGFPLPGQTQGKDQQSKWTVSMEAVSRCLVRHLLRKPLPV